MYIRDESVHGVIINDIKVTKSQNHELHPGDYISFGQNKTKFRLACQVLLLVLPNIYIRTYNRVLRHDLVFCTTGLKDHPEAAKQISDGAAALGWCDNRRVK